MTTTTRRWLPTINRAGIAALALAAVGTISALSGTTDSAANTAAQPVANAAAAAGTQPVGDANATPAAAPAPAEAPPAQPAPAGAPAAPAPAPAAAPAPAPAAPAPAPPVEMGLPHSFELQSTGYYCGPAAARVALSAQGKVYGQDHVAQQLGTTPNGTDNVRQITKLLNAELGAGRYAAYDIPGPKATDAERQKLKADVVSAITQGKPVVANIAGVTTDDAGEVHSYVGGHYIPVVGYFNNGDTVLIADSADKVGSPSYFLSIDKLANWIASRGYTA